MAKSSRAGRRGQAGFTLAGVLVIITVLMIFIAYTIPKQWSAVMQREREQQTIYAMRQYARACYEFQKKHNVWPVSIDQLKEARLPRFLRGGGEKNEILDPLTGQYDWLVIPASAAGTMNGGTAGTGTVPNGNGGGTSTGGGGVGFGRGDGTTGTTGTTGTDGTSGNGTQTLPGIPIKDYAGGPFIGVRPPKTGDAIIEFRGGKAYEQWSFTAMDLDLEIQAYRLGIQNSTQFK
jgi:type II secretory pathway pseudopilin PulG